MLRNLTRFFIQSAIGGKQAGGSFFTDLFASALGSAFSFSGGLTQKFANGVALPTRRPTRAAGGPVSRGKTFMVGERGPEPFTPTSAGFIRPNNSMGGGGNIVDITIINNGTNTRATATETGSGSNRSIEVVIDDIVAGKINTTQSRTSKALKNSRNQGVIRR